MKRFGIAILFGCWAMAGAAQVAEQSCVGDHSAWLAAHADEMAGTWIDTPVVGLMVGRPMPPGPPEPIDLTAIPNGFSAIGEEPRRLYELRLTDAPFAIEPPGGATELARLDREEVPNCAITDLPHLTASYLLEIDGQMVEGTIVAVVASTRVIHIWFGLDTGFGRVEQLSRMTR
ncbi:MAG: hypothetical protein AAFY31_05195 [Pseudomonadota bacterium]